MEIVWREQAVTADQVLAALGTEVTNATVRTVLRRIEAKGYLQHRVEGRAFVYSPVVAADAAAANAIARVLQRFFGGSAEQLVQGLLDGRFIDRRRLEKLASRVDAKRPRVRR